MGIEYYIGQAIGIIAMIISFLSYQMAEPKKLIVVQSVSTSMFCIHYLLLGSNIAFIMNLACVVRNICFYYKEKVAFLKKFAPIFFTVFIGLLGFLAWENIFSILMIIALTINTFCMSLGDNQLLRKSILFTSTLVMIYNLILRSVGGSISEILAITSSAIALVRYRKTKNEKQ